MNNLTDLEYLRLNKFQKLLYNFCHFFTAIPHKIVSLFCRIGRFFKKIGIAVANFFKLIGSTFVHGDWKTKVSYFILGFGNLFRGQILRGLLFLIFEVSGHTCNVGAYLLFKLFDNTITGRILH